MPTQDRAGLPVEQLVLLWAARRSGILDALLASAGTPAEVAETAGVTLHAARVTVSALDELGFLEQVGTEYEITNRTLGFLAKRDVRSIGRLPHALDRLDLWTTLPETMATGEPPEKPPDWTRNRLGAHAATDEAVVRACVTAAVRERSRDDADRPTRILDVAGESGVFARELLARGFDVTLAADEEVIDVVTPLLEPTAIDLVATDLPSLAGVEQHPPEFDLVFGVDVLHRFSATTNETLVSAAADRLTVGGTVVFVETLDRRMSEQSGQSEQSEQWQQSGQSNAAVSLAVNTLAVGVGGLYDEQTARAWFEDAGLVGVTVRTVPGTDRRAVVGHAPRDD